jgi:magnesium-transporting ATPase (P-type)
MRQQSCDSFTLIKRLPFTSERKRMSVIIQQAETKTATLFTKGADSVIS